MGRDKVDTSERHPPACVVPAMSKVVFLLKAVTEVDRAVLMLDCLHGQVYLEPCL